MNNTLIHAQTHHKTNLMEINTTTAVLAELHELSSTLLNLIQSVNCHIMNLHELMTHSKTPLEVNVEDINQ